MKRPAAEDLPVRRRTPCVVVAEDDGEFRRLLAEVLWREGYRVIEASDGYDLMHQIVIHIVSNERHDPLDLVVSDVRMPGSSGLDVLSCARTAGYSVPFILITAFGDGEIHSRARSLDAAAVLDKPFDVPDLVELVRVLAPIDEEPLGKGGGALT
jgi:CheY-like chemotaxis protein